MLRMCVACVAWVTMRMAGKEERNDNNVWCE